MIRSVHKFFLVFLAVSLVFVPVFSVPAQGRFVRLARSHAGALKDIAKRFFKGNEAAPSEEMVKNLTDAISQNLAAKGYCVCEPQKKVTALEPFRAVGYPKTSECALVTYSHGDSAFVSFSQVSDALQILKNNLSALASVRVPCRSIEPYVQGNAALVSTGKKSCTLVPYSTKRGNVQVWQAPSNALKVFSNRSAVVPAKTDIDGDEPTNKRLYSRALALGVAGAGCAGGYGLYAWSKKNTDTEKEEKEKNYDAQNDETVESKQIKSDDQARDTKNIPLWAKYVGAGVVLVGGVYYFGIDELDSTWRAFISNSRAIVQE